MQRKRDGWFSIGDIFSGLSGSTKKSLQPTPQALHHFTQADQVNQLATAREADPDLGFMARMMALCSLPRTNPGNRLQYKRANGPYTLYMTATAGNKLPFGTLPRLLLAWVSRRKNPNNPEREERMASLFDKTKGMENIAEILSQMEANIPHPSSTSQKLWQLRRATDIISHNRSRETMLEKAVAMLAENGHMPGWFNQCPTASGIGDSSRSRHSNVDLVHWSRSGRRARLVELKWDSDSPSEAVRQVLRYGAAYLFCRMHRNRLPVWRDSVMDACDIKLQVAAPARYYTDSGLRYCLSRARENLTRFDIGSRIDGLSMSLDVLALPEWFDSLPFADGEEVRAECDTAELTEAGRKVRDAFDGLASVCPEADGLRQ